MIDITKDGIDHINVYSGSRTALGRMLSNFYEDEIWTKDGLFKSVEAYWHWLCIDEKCDQREKLRELSGIKSKNVGQYLRAAFPGNSPDDFRDRIIRAIWWKVKRHTDLFLPQYENLPLKHYMVSGGKARDVYGKYWWMIEAQEKMKKYIYDQKRKGESV